MRISLIEDNIDLAIAIADRLQDIGHSVTLLDTGEGATEFLLDSSTDLAIIDINLPIKTGLEILQEIRSKKSMIPVILLTARDSIEDKVKGLDLGADDYLVKPFAMEELEARLRAQFRRHTPHSITADRIGDIHYDFGARILTTKNEKILKLPRRELMLFECLMIHKGKLCDKSFIAEYIFGLDSDSYEKSVETYISRLRKKLESYGVTIKVARGLGYMLGEI